MKKEGVIIRSEEAGLIFYLLNVKCNHMNKFNTLAGNTVSFNSKHGAEIYRRSLILLLQSAVRKAFPEITIEIGQTLMHGYYFENSSGQALPDDFIQIITAAMNSIVAEDIPFKMKEVSKKQAMELFTEAGRGDKVRALNHCSSNAIKLVYLGDYFDYVITECASSTGFLRHFRLISYNHGFIMQFPQKGPQMILPETNEKQEKLYGVYVETRRRGEILGVSRVPDLNSAVKSGDISTIIKVQEAFHEKKIAYIADSIQSLYPEKKIVFVAGPSSSGKTTFIKRLAIQLRVNGFIPVEISLDDYFVPREKTPRKPSGEYDFECLEALDTEFFSGQINTLVKGGEILLPKYNFKTGKRVSSGKRLKLSRNSIIIVEGIHALNPELSAGLDESIKHKIFVSALTQLRIDNDTRIFTSDSRLIRRIVRDSLFRGYSAYDSIKRFPLVREGEDIYVFPFQDDADIFFNSSLVYEQAVLKPLLVERLKKIKDSGPELAEARRLMNYLDFFTPIPADEVPQNSILREFIGESGFSY